MPGPGHRQQVTGDGAPDRLVAKRDLPARIDEKTVLDRLGQTRSQIGIEDAISVAWPRHGTWRRSAGPGIERRRHGRQLVGAHRSLGQGHQAQDPTALLGSDRQASSHEPIEGAGQRRRRELASGRQQLLRDERQATRALRDEKQQAGRRAFTLDALDERREVIAIERPQRHSFRCTRACGHLALIGDPGIPTGDGIGLMRADDGQSLVVGDPGEERDKRTGRGIGAVQVLQHEHDRGSLAESPKQPQDPFQRAGLAALGSRSPGASGEDAFVKPVSEIGQQPQDLRGGRAEGIAEIIQRQLVQRGTDGSDEWAVRFIDAAWPGTRAQNDHRLRQGLYPDDRLIQEPGDADTGRPLDQQRAGTPMGGILKARGEPTERGIPPHESRARVPDRHEAF